MVVKARVLLVTFNILLYSKGLYVNCANQPNILYILADDLGYNDVGYRGNNQVKTPNIDALAYNGAILERFYTMPTCTPSRTAIMTGMYPIRTGNQGLPALSGEERHLPANVTTLPQHLRKLGYKTHLVGKWHLGYAWRNATPIGRGFHTHYGYYNGKIGYFNHESGDPSGMRGLDFRDNYSVNRKDTGRYATDLFTKRTVKIIQEHDYRKPFFILLSHLAVHTGKSISTYTSLMEERDSGRMNKTFGYIKEVNRRRYVDVLNVLDESVGIVIKALAQKGVLENTIIFFQSDNGAPTYGDFHPNYGSNWPLRGIKLGHFEGAVRGTAIFYSKNMTYTGKVNSNLMHMVDLLPTFYAAGGGQAKDLGNIDGLNQLDSLMKNKRTKREELLVNIEDVAGSSAIITNGGRYKLIKGVQYNGTFDKYGGVSGRLPEDGPYDVDAIVRSDTNEAFGRTLNASSVQSLRKLTMTKNCRKPSNVEYLCELCLFDLQEDPCETTNIADSHRGLVNHMLDKLKYFRSQTVKQQNKPADPKADPKRFEGIWTYWLDANPLQ